MRQVIYKISQINSRGDEFGTEEKQGGFVAFTPDFKNAVIETTYGEIIHVHVNNIRFLHPQEDTK